MPHQTEEWVAPGVRVRRRRHRRSSPPRASVRGTNNRDDVRNNTHLEDRPYIRQRGRAPPESLGHLPSLVRYASPSQRSAVRDNGENQYPLIIHASPTQQNRDYEDRQQRGGPLADSGRLAGGSRRVLRAPNPEDEFRNINTTSRREAGLGDDYQLQQALESGRRESISRQRLSAESEESQLQRALELSRRESIPQRRVSSTSDDAQLQLALENSRRESIPQRADNQRDRRLPRGLEMSQREPFSLQELSSDSDLQRAIDASKRDEADKRATNALRQERGHIEREATRKEAPSRRVHFELNDLEVQDGRETQRHAASHPAVTERLRNPHPSSRDGNSDAARRADDGNGRTRVTTTRIQPELGEGEINITLRDLRLGDRVNIQIEWKEGESRESRQKRS